MRPAARITLGVAVAACAWLLPSSAAAVPVYTRLYGVNCTSCHSMWGSLNVNGATFRLSGYRAMAGEDLPPVDKPIPVGKGISLPGVFPVSLVTGVAVEYRQEQRDAPAALRDPPGESGTITRAGSNLTVADASIFLTAPLGDHLAFFIEFPMFETKAWEFTPTGPGEARVAQRGDLSLPTEAPVFEVAKFWWNDLLGKRAPRDSVNLLGGITHLPLAYPSGKVRLSVNQYLVYERRGLDYISPRPVDVLFTEDPAVADRLFRLGEPQGMLEVNGMIVPGAPVEAVSKRQTPWLEYHVGGTNASNTAPDGNVAKGVYGRFVARWYNQSLGVFGLWTPDLVDQAMIDAATATGPGGRRIIRAGSFSSSRVSAGPDATLSLAPFKIPVSLENDVLYNRESNPTGYGKEFVWWGGFHQLNWFATKTAVVYGRYDWITGDHFDDTGAGGESNARPLEWDVVGGLQFLVVENLKIILEYRHHAFDDRITSGKSTLTDDGFTVRAMTGF